MKAKQSHSARFADAGTGCKIRWRGVFPGILLLVLFFLNSVGFPQSSMVEMRPANGFNLRNLQFQRFVPGARALGMGGGAIALADDPAATMLNPAGMALISRSALSATTRLQSTKFFEPDVHPLNGPGTLEERDINLDQTLISATLSLGAFQVGSFWEIVNEFRHEFAVRHAFQSNGEAPVDEVLRRHFPSRQVVLHSKVVDNGVSLAVRISQRLFVGAALRLSRLEYRLNERQYLESDWNRTPEAPNPVSEFRIENLYLWQTVDKRRTRPGFVIGMLTRLSSRLLVGATYHHRPSFNMTTETFLPEFRVQRGDSTTIFPAATVPGGNFRFNLPDTWGVGIAYKYRGWWNFTVDFVRILFSEMAQDPEKNQLVDLIQNDHLSPPPPGPDLRIKNRWEVRSGLEYIFRLKSRRRLPVRVGYYYQPPGIFYARDPASPLAAAYPQIKSRSHLTLGLGFFFNERLRIDGAADFSRAGFVLQGSSVYTF